jgi:hypothetical protein
VRLARLAVDLYRTVRSHYNYIYVTTLAWFAILGRGVCADRAADTAFDGSCRCASDVVGSYVGCSPSARQVGE